LGSKTSHACSIRRIFEKVGKNRVITIGTRSASKEEIEEARNLGLRYFTSWEYEKAINEIPFDKIYLSLDIDVFDPCYAPGVSNPEPVGLGYEIFDFIKDVAKKIVAMDIVEVCPPYDDGRASLLAAKIIRDFIAWRNKISQIFK